MDAPYLLRPVAPTVTEALPPWPAFVMNRPQPKESAFELRPGASPSPRQRGAGKGAQTHWQPKADAFPRDGLLSPALSSEGREGGSSAGGRIKIRPKRDAGRLTGRKRLPRRRWSRTRAKPPKATHEPATSHILGSSEPPTSHPHATFMRPSCDPHATLMRPSCQGNHQALPAGCTNAADLLFRWGQLKSGG